MFAVDTNLLLYAVDELSPHHRQSAAMFETWRGERRSWYLTWGVIYEFMRVSTHSKVFRTPLTIKQSWDFIDALIDSPGCAVLVAGPGHATVIQESIATVKHLQGNLLHDFHTAVLMREHGVRTIYTNDMDFHRFPWVEVVNPLA